MKGCDIYDDGIEGHDEMVSYTEVTVTRVQRGNRCADSCSLDLCIVYCHWNLLCWLVL